MNRVERETLREAALRAIDQAASRPWTLQTSNSFRRIGALGDGDVLCGVVQRSDGQPDLHASPGVLDYIVAAQPNIVLKLIAALDVSEEALSQARGTETLDVVEKLKGDYVRCPHADGSWFEGTIVAIDGPVLDPFYYSIKVEKVSDPPPMLDNGPVLVGQRILDGAPRSFRSILLIRRDGKVAGSSLGSALRDRQVATVETVGSAMAVLRRLDYGCLDADIRRALTDARSALAVVQSKIKERIDR